MPEGLLHQLAEFGEASAMIAAAAALIGLWLTVRENQRTAREKEILDWQKVIVYEIIRTRGPIAAADILGFYLDQERLFKISILKDKMLRGDALTSILLNLISEHAIMVLPEEDKEPEYAIVRATRQQMPGDAFSAMDARNLQQAKDIRDLLYHIEQNNGKFTIAELKEYLERAARYDKSRIDAVDDFLLRFETLYQFVARDKDGRLWRRWPTIVTPPSVTPPPPASVAPTQSPSAAGQQTTFGRHSTATPSPPLNDPTQRIDR